MSTFCYAEPKQYVAKAKTKVRVTANYHRLDRLSKQMAKAVSIDLTKGITTFRNRIKPDDMLQAWKSGSYGHLMATIPWEALPEDLDRYDLSMRKTWGKATDFTIESLPAPINRHLRFDINNPRIRKYIHSHTGELIVDIHKDTQKIVQQAVQRVFTHAATPRKVANQIRNSIGLDPRREMALANYRNGLEASGTHSEDVIDRLTNRYANELLESRAMTIGRTETRFASNRGQLSVWHEAASQDLLPRNTSKVWVVDGNPCEICEPMDGESVPLEGMWRLNTGESVEIPTDSHPNCYCGMELEMGDD